MLSRISKLICFGKPTLESLIKCVVEKKCVMELKINNRSNTVFERKVYSRDQLLTIGDLEKFREDLLKEIKYILIQKQTPPEKQWLKSGEVRNLLKISPGTLQHLRNTGKISFTQVGGTFYYDYEAIRAMLERRC